MKIARHIIFVVHLIITVSFIITHSFNYLSMLLAVVWHYLTVSRHSGCFPSHCKMTPPLTKYQQKCNEPNCCKTKWIRMKHCYKCGQCIHKFDHHCVLMDVCIGEFNHKYYLLFLLCFLWNILVMLVIFTQQMRDEVQINELGVESYTVKYYLYAFSLLAVYFHLILTSYLTYFHLYFTSNNQTTWEYYKRSTIQYFQNFNSHIDHPFSQGVLNNYRQMFASHSDSPIRWDQWLD